MVMPRIPDLSAYLRPQQKRRRGGFAGFLDRIESPISRTASRVGGGILKGIDVPFRAVGGEATAESLLLQGRALLRGDIGDPRRGAPSVVRREFLRQTGEPLQAGTRQEQLEGRFASRGIGSQLLGRFIADPLTGLPALGVATKVVAGSRAAARLGQLATSARAVKRIADVEDAETIQKVTNILKGKAKTLQESIEEARTPIRGARAGQAQLEFERTLRATNLGQQQRLIRKAGAARAGELPTTRFADPVQDVLGISEVDIFRLNRVIVREGAQRFGVQYEALNALQSLQAMLFDGIVPTKSARRLIGKFLGSEFETALGRATGEGRDIAATLFDLASFPRAILASYDLSAPLRQGIVASTAHPVAATRAFGAMVKSFARERWSREAEAVILGRKNFTVGDRTGLYFAREFAKFSEREEAYASRLATLIPGIRRSERAFRTYLNKLRADTFDNVISEWQRAGKYTGSASNLKQLQPELEKVSRIINASTGRGTIPKGFFTEEIAGVANAAFFSPRLLISRVELPVEFVKALMTNPADVAKGIFLQRGLTSSQILARDLVRFTGVSTGILGGLGLAGAEIGFNPVSSDFGKAKFGDTRIEWFGGFQQIATLTARLSLGETASLGTGEIFDADRLDVITRFIRTKFSPAVGLITDTITGETFLGDEFQAGRIGANRFTAEQFFERLAPLFAQDMLDAITTDGAGMMAAVAAPAFFGANVGSFTTTGDVRQDVAQEAFGKDFRDLDLLQQSEVNRNEAVTAAREQGNLSKASQLSLDERERRDRRLTSLVERDGVKIAGNASLAQDFRDGFNDIRFENAIGQQVLNKAFNRFKDRRELPEAGSVDRAIIEYLLLFDTPIGETLTPDSDTQGILDIAEQPDFDLLDQRLAEFNWSPEQQEAVDRFIREGLPVETQPFLEHRQELRRIGWFDFYKKTPEYQGLNQKTRDLIDGAMNAQREGTLVQFAAQNAGPQATQLRNVTLELLDLSKGARIEARVKDIDLDFDLFRWDGSAPATLSTQVRGWRFLEAEGLSELDLMERLLVKEAGTHLGNDVVGGFADVGIETLLHLANATVTQLRGIRDRNGDRAVSRNLARFIIQQAQTLVRAL